MSEVKLSSKNELSLEPKPKTAKYYLISILGFLIMAFFQYIPAPAPITPAGMGVLGLFIGLIILWSFVDMVWPTFLAIVMFGYYAFAIFPQSFQLHGIYEAGAQSFGNWIVVYLIGTLLLAVALQEVGTIRRITMWFLTRKFAKQSPWKFTFMFFLAALIIGLFLDVTTIQFFMLFIAYEVFEEVGFKKGDAWPKISFRPTLPVF
jgi:sodium-dependent dicarboxylate transporter 2/3/5